MKLFDFFVINKNKKSQIAIQYIISFVLMTILIILSFLFVFNSFKKVNSLVEEKIVDSNFYYLRNLVFGFSGFPPYWDEEHVANEDILLIGYSIKPFVLDYSKITINNKIKENNTLYMKFLDYFSYDVSELNINLVEKRRKWVAYYKIKTLDPLVFSRPYGYLKIFRNATSLVIEYNFSNVSNINPSYKYNNPNFFSPYFLLELLSDVKLNVSYVEGGINYTEEVEPFFYYRIFSNKDKESGKIVLNYACRKVEDVLECNYPRTLVIKRLECDPLELCELSGFIEGSSRLPLIGWFGMIHYKKLARELEAKEIIYNGFLKMPLSYYVVEFHIFVLKD